MGVIKGEFLRNLEVELGCVCVQMCVHTLRDKKNQARA